MSKYKLIIRVKEIIGNKVSYFDVASIVNILIDELKQELIDNRLINIPNLGKIHLKTFKARMITNVNTKEKHMSKNYNVMRFNLSRTINRFIIANGTAKI
jgi:nucleoid DNA-binding protein